MPEKAILLRRFTTINLTFGLVCKKRISIT